MAQAKKATVSRKAAASRGKPAAKQTRAKKPKCSAEERYRLIQEEAYFLAEKAGFRGDSAEYWFLAEQAVDARLDGK